LCAIGRWFGIWKKFNCAVAAIFAADEACDLGTSFTGAVTFFGTGLAFFATTNFFATAFLGATFEATGLLTGFLAAALAFLATAFLGLEAAAFFLFATGFDFFAFFADFAFLSDFLCFAIFGYKRLIKDLQNYRLLSKTKNII
jgi:hypothetical protein